jgi:hypothetical protein
MNLALCRLFPTCFINVAPEFSCIAAPKIPIPVYFSKDVTTERRGNCGRFVYF